MDTLVLNEVQRERAIDLYKKASNGKVRSPTDVVESWETPKRDIDYDNHDGEFPRQKGFISPANIAGTFDSTIHRVETGRLRTVLAWLVKGEYRVQDKYPPVVQKREGRYYVTSDGHHRCMAAKAVGLDEFYVEYSEVPTELLQ